MISDTTFELARALPAEVAENAVALLTEMTEVIEGIGDEPIRWKPPYLRLVQGTTDRTSLPKGTAPGDFVLGETRLEQPFKFIPIMIYDQRTYWDPDQTSSKILCWSPDSKLGQIGKQCKTCEHAVWGEDSPSDCGKAKQVLAISADLRQVFTITFAKSGYKVGMELEKIMANARTLPFHRTYGLSSTTNPNAKNVEVFKIETLDEKSRRTQQEYLKFLNDLFNTVRADRKTMIEAFYENVKARQTQQALPGAAATPALTDSSASATEVAAPVEGGVSSMAMKYEV